jgi:hypothetical protein
VLEGRHARTVDDRQVDGASRVRVRFPPVRARARQVSTRADEGDGASRGCRVGLLKSPASENANDNRGSMVSNDLAKSEGQSMIPAWMIPSPSGSFYQLHS